MKFGSLGAAVAAVSLGFMPVAKAQTVTIGEAIQVFGDLNALLNICPDMDLEAPILSKYMKENSFTDEMIGEKSPYFYDINSATKRSFEARKSMSINDNCKNAFDLYGENGTVIRGLIMKKDPSVAK